MNPQPDPYIGHFFATLFVLTVIFQTIKAIRDNKTFSINDNFVIGYIEQNPTIALPISINNPEHKIKKNLKPEKIKLDIKPKKATPSISNINKDTCENIDDRLHKDCIDALVALGMRKKEAKEKTKYIFSTVKPPPSNVQAFLFIVFQKS